MPGKYRPRLDVLHTLKRGTVAEAFHASGAQDYLAKVSIFNTDGLDIHATAQKIGIPVVYSSQEFGGRYTPRITLEKGPAPRINLAPDLDDEALTFAHEVGHHYLDDELYIGYQLVGTIDEPISEAFCEFFGYKMSRTAPSDDNELEALVKDRYEIPVDYDAYILEKIMEQPRRW